MLQGAGFRNGNATQLNMPAQNDLGWRFAMRFRNPKNVLILQNILYGIIATSNRTPGFVHDAMLCILFPLIGLVKERMQLNLIQTRRYPRFLNQPFIVLRQEVADSNGSDISTFLASISACHASTYMSFFGLGQ